MRNIFLVRGSKKTTVPFQKIGLVAESSLLPQDHALVKSVLTLTA